MNLLDEKTDMLTKVGALFGQMLAMVSAPERFDAQEKAEVTARYFHDATVLEQSMRLFALRQPGHNYEAQHLQVRIALSNLRLELVKGKEVAKDLVEQTSRQCMNAVLAVPATDLGEVVEAGSPFSVYTRLRQICESEVSSDLVWIDPYLSASVLFRYLRHVPAGLRITAVTEQPKPDASRRDKARWTALVDVASLFAIDREPSGFELKANSDLHDRWLVLDGKRIFHFGGSVKDAAHDCDFTISRLEPTEENLRVVLGKVTSAAPIAFSEARQRA